MYICETCGKEFSDDYRISHSKDNPRFCSRSCANKRVHSEETKNKISNSVKHSEKAIKARELIKINLINSNKRKHLRCGVVFKSCPVCGQEFETTLSENKIYCGNSCWTKVSGGLREGSGRSKSGYYKGIYCGSTYELCWVIYNLDHNIKFTRSKLQIPYEYKNKKYKYYPDFELEDGTLIEIKGYNTELVDVKTESAKSLGYKIFVLYEKDLQYAFDYVKEHYSVTEFSKLYDYSKKVFTYVCDICGKEFKRTKEIEKEKPKLCSRSCSGKYLIKNYKKK